MERRTLLAVVLSFVVLYAYQTFFMPKPPAEAPATQVTPPEAAPLAGAPSSAAQPPAAVAAAPPAAEAPVVIGDTVEYEFTLETRTVRAVFINRGARLAHWILKDYTDSAGRPVDLVPQDLPSGQPLPFSLRVDTGDLTRRLNSALFRSTRIEGSATTAAGLVFDFQDASGLTVRKEFRLDPATYLVTFNASVRQGDQELTPYVQWGPALGDLGVTSGGGFFTSDTAPPPEAIFHNGDKVERISFTGVDGSPVHEGAFRFAGVDDHYFIVAVVNPGQVRVEYRGLTQPMPGDRQRQLLLHTVQVPQSAKGLKYYIGPKAFDTLKAVDGEFVRAINFGFWAFIAVPFLGVLKWIYSYVGNYGWAIILLTILMNMVIFPLRHKSVVSMRKMQDLQPQLKVIQDRYADLKMTDPSRQKMNSEVMGLYREKGVNPASGCIPMVLTFPVLFAFYSLLSQAIELRGAPFGFWIHDLSQRDPYYVTPLLMGVTMFWQQKITPTSVDPAQQRMMMFMPVVFVAMFLTFPSGLAIYYFVNNVWAIGQQYFTNWLIGPPTVHVPRPAAERLVKSAGAGRTERAEKKT